MLFFITTLNILFIAILLLIKIAVIYLLLKLFKEKAIFLKVIKFILVYEIVATLFFLVYEELTKYFPKYINFGTLGSGSFVFLIYSVPFLVILFLIFFFFSKRLLSLNLKKTLYIFILLSLVMYLVSPLLNYATRSITSISIFGNELKQISARSVLLDKISGKNSHPIFSATTTITSSIENPGYYIFILATTHLK